MFTSFQRLSALSATLALASCATVPKPLQGDYVSNVPSGETLTQGALVRWGGEVLDVETMSDRTCFQILSRELNAEGRPKQYSKASGGRFLACHPAFFDPALYPEGTEVTVVGNMSGFETRKIGDYDLNMPRVTATTVYLWPDRPEWPYDYNYGPYPYYSPFWFGFYPSVYYVHGGHHHH